MAAVLESAVEETQIWKLEANVAIVKNDVAHVQSDITEIKTDIREKRKDIGALKADVSALRDAMHTESATLRHEMLLGDASLLESIENVRHEIVRHSLSDRIWMFAFAAGFVTVIAHGFKLI